MSASYCVPIAFILALKPIPLGMSIVRVALFGNSCFTKRMSCRLPLMERFARRFFVLCKLATLPLAFTRKCCGISMYNFLIVKAFILPCSVPPMLIRFAGMVCNVFAGTDARKGCRSSFRTNPFTVTAILPGFSSAKAFKSITMSLWISLSGIRK